MRNDVEAQLINGLDHAHVMEVQCLRLLRTATHVAGDEDVEALYWAHLLQSVEHERRIAQRLAAHGEQLRPAPIVPEPDLIATQTETPITLAATAYAFEHHEIAVYQLLRELARRADDEQTATVAEELLEEEQAAAELVASTFDRAIGTALGEPATSALRAPQAFVAAMLGVSS